MSVFYVDGHELIGQAAIMEWNELKSYIVEASNLNQDALHVYFAILIQLFSAWCLRRSIASPLPWLAVLIAVLINEYLDYHPAPADPIIKEIYLAEAYRDLWNTMLMPTLLLVIARLWPQRLVKPAVKKNVVHSKSEDPADS